VFARGNRPIWKNANRHTTFCASMGTSPPLSHPGSISRVNCRLLARIKTVLASISNTPWTKTGYREYKSGSRRGPRSSILMGRGCITRMHPVSMTGFPQSTYLFHHYTQAETHPDRSKPIERRRSCTPACDKLHFQEQRLASPYDFPDLLQ
jgi:hypothetical protein